MKPFFSFFLLVLVLLPACRIFDPKGVVRDEGYTFSDSTLATDTSRARFAELRAHWDATEPAAYRFTYSRNCFCIDRGPYTVDVRGGAIVDLQPPSDQPYVRQTMDSLYATVEAAFARNAASVQYQYDPASRLLASFFIDYDEGIADEEMGASVSEIVFRR